MPCAATSPRRSLAAAYVAAVAEAGRAVGMTDADMDLWRRLSDPASPDHLLDQPDYYCVLSPLLALGRAPR